MNRRQFLGAFGLGTIGLILLDGMILTPPANAAVPAMVVVAIIQTAISIVKLFSSRDDDPASQIGSMLAAISRELVVIQEGIKLILSKLDVIEELIGEIPQAVVQETERATIAGLLKVYTLTMDTYARDCEDQGIAFSQAKNIPPLENQVIVPLKTSIAILTGYHAAGMVPIICAASYVHVQAMILANYSKNDLLPVLGMYQKWLTEMVELLTNEIAELNESLNGLQEKLLDFQSQSVSPFYCTYSNPARPWEGTAETWAAFVVYHDVDPRINMAAGEMVSKKLMPMDQLPHSAELVFTKMLSSPLDLPIPPSTCPDEIKGRQEAFNAIAPPLPEMGLKLMSRRALKHAAETTLKALIEQRQLIEKFG